MDRAQIHTLEAFLAALLLVAAILFATQATAVTPLSASTSNQHIENQHRAMTTDLLAVTHENGSLEGGLTYWNTTHGEKFNDSNTDLGYYTHVPPEENPLHEPLKDAFGEGQLAYNVEVTYLTDAENTSTQTMIHMGTPSDNAVTATKTVVLYDDDEISWEDEARTLGELYDDEPGNFYAPNVDDSTLYNVVEVRITIWRM